MERLPQFAAWRFVDAVEGFEVVYTALDLTVRRLDQTYRPLHVRRSI